jgi:hypothetical protein
MDPDPLAFWQTTTIENRTLSMKSQHNPVFVHYAMSTDLKKQRRENVYSIRAGLVFAEHRPYMAAFEVATEVYAMGM